MQCPTHDIQPPRKPNGPESPCLIHRYPPPISGECTGQLSIGGGGEQCHDEVEGQGDNDSWTGDLSEVADQEKDGGADVGAEPIIRTSFRPRSLLNDTSTEECAFG